MGEDGSRPALLGSLDRLVVPIRALDQAYRDDAAVLAGPADQAANVVLRVAQVRLHDHAGLIVASELVLLEELLKHGEGEIAVAELLEVEIHERTRLLGFAEDGAQAVLDRLHRAAEVERVDLREERGDLDRDVDARQRTPSSPIDGGIGFP